MSTSAAVPPNPLVYEINTRVWLRELSQRHRQPMQLDTVPDEELDRIAELGFHAVWLMGVWTTGDLPRLIARTTPDLQGEYRAALLDYTADDCVGSPYAISAYTVSETLGGRGALARLRERLARRGLCLLLDFVCNHMACDHPWLATNPDVFIQATPADLAAQPGHYFRAPNGGIFAHARDPYYPPWTDTVQINYGQPAARQAMLGLLFELAEQCDGLRCDMAMLPLTDVFLRVWQRLCGPNPLKTGFWSEAIPAVLARHPNFLFVAEAYWEREADLQREGFPYTYDKTLYDRLLHEDVPGLRQHLSAPLSYQSKSVRFIENHDEPRAATAFGAPRSIAAAVTLLFAPGMKLIHEGQLEGRRSKVPVQLGRRRDEAEDAAIESAYDHLFAILRDPIFQTGQFALAEVQSAGPGDRTHEALLALRWTQCAEQSARCPRRCGYLIVINLSGTRAYARIPFGPAEAAQEKQFLFDDRFAAKRYDREGSELQYPGLYVALEAYQPHVFEITERG